MRGGGRGRKGRKVQGEEYLTFIIYEVKNLLFHKSYKKNHLAPKNVSVITKMII